jgi:hypothetical protein
MTRSKKGPNDPKRLDPGNYNNLHNVCAVERSNGGARNGFWQFYSINGFSEPFVRGRTVFVRTNCADQWRLPIGEQTDPYYIKAIQNGAQLPYQAYEGWRKVWQNPSLDNRMLGEHVGVVDDGFDLVCFSMETRYDYYVRDAEVTH